MDRAIHGNRPVASFGLRVEDPGHSLFRVNLGCRNAPEPGRGVPLGSRKNGAPAHLVRHGTQILFGKTATRKGGKLDPVCSPAPGTTAFEFRRPSVSARLRLSLGPRLRGEEAGPYLL